MMSRFHLKIFGRHIPVSTYTRRKALATLAPLVVLIILSVAPASALAAAPEAPTAGPVSAVTATKATFEGVVNPGTLAEQPQSGTYEFLYKASTKQECEGESKGSQGMVFGVGAEPVPAEPVSGLKPGTEYAVCLRVENAAKEAIVSPAVTFTTVAAPKTEAVTLVGSTTATFNGKLTPLNATVPTEYFFYYNFGEEPACNFEQATGAVDAGTGPGTTDTVSMAVSGLEPGEKYTVCLAAYNTLGAFEVDPSSSPIHFETKPAPPEIVAESESATPVTPDEEALGAQVNANNQETTYTFEYSLKAKGETLEAPVTTLSGAVTKEPFGAQQVTVNAPGLVQNTTYYYRVTAENAASEKAIPGKVESFTTLLETPETLPANPVTSSAATLNGVLSPNATARGEAGTYEFAYRQSASECQGEGGKTAPAPATVAQGGKEAVSVTLTGLPPDTTYTYCLLERSAANATAVGSAMTFTTRGAGISEEYVSNVEATAAILHAEIDPNESSTTYHFEYDTTPYTTSAPHGTSQPLPGAVIPAGTSPVPVNAQLQSLQPGTTYYYRVVAVSELSPTELETFDGPNKTFTTPAEPTTTAETCPNARARTEQPYGQALPDCRAYELVSPLDKNDRNAEAIGSRAAVSDEAPAVAYVSHGSFSGPQGAREVNRYISKRGADGWSTQSVTPRSVAFEGGRVAFAELLFTPDLSQGLLASEDVPLVEGEAAGYDNLYVADLASTPASYQTVTNVNPPGASPYLEGDEGNPKAVGASTDLSHVVFQQHFNLTPNAEGEHRDHVYEWVAGKLSLVDVPPAGTKFEYGDVAGAPGNLYLPEWGDTWHAVSANGLRVFFTAGESAHGAENEGPLYVRENPEQEQSLEENGKCTEPDKACTVEVSASQRTDCADHNPCSGTSEPDPNGPQPAYYRDANAEGTRVFFTSKAELTNDANTGPDDTTANLYEYNVETGALTDLTAPTGIEDPEGAAVLGLVTAGENAGEENSYVYFVANGVLASNENTNKETAQRGDCRGGETARVGEFAGQHLTCSLYVAHNDNGKWETKFIATLIDGNERVENDETDWVGYEGGTLENDLGPGSHTVRVTPDGTTLAFESERSLTGYDNEPVEPGAGAPGHKCTEQGSELKASNPAVPCREVFVYDAVTGKLVCASCDPSGARPVGRAELGGQEAERANDLEPSVYYLSRNLSEAGGRLFFQSPDPLVSHDSNGQLDVYEWERPASPVEAARGENSCTSSSPTFSVSGGGCVFPISDVAGDFESRFMDASPSGDNVFVETKDQLVPEADADSRANVYDVRVGGGFPVSLAPPVCDNGDSCKPPVSAQPSIFAASGSATFSGLGNPAAAVAAPPPKKTVKKAVKCKKGFVKNKQGKCVKRKRSKRAEKSAKGRK
jgi:hypothetical protein